MPRFTERADMQTLPVIPLRGLVAFPSIPLSFEIERDISVAACDAATESGSAVLLVTQRDISCTDPTKDDVFDVGCVARIKHCTQRIRTQQRTRWTL